MEKHTYTSIYFSGVEGERFYDTAYNFGQTRHMLMSFLYCGAKGNNWFASRVKKGKDVRWMIDSGAHSFRMEGFNEKWPDMAWFEDYVVRYRDWLLANKDIIDLAVNLDIDNVVGIAKMKEWDSDIFRPLERAGVPICYVWHDNYGFEYWEQMCREHEFVGLPGHLSEAEYQKLMKVAIANGCRVHGFAATKGFILGHVPFATVDSTSWKAGERYGQTFVFEGGKLRTFDKNQKAERKRYKSRWTALGVDWAELEKDTAEPITQVCAVAWADYQAHTKVLTEKLAYWNKTSKMVDDLGDIKNLTAESIKQFYKDLDFPFPVENDANARQDLTEIRAFLARDPTVVMALSDDRVDWWVRILGADPENDQRVEKEAAIRQCLYKTFYRINATEALARDESGHVEPVKKYLPRTEELRAYPGVEVALPPEIGHDSLDPSDPGFILVSHTETNAPGTGSEDSSNPDSDSDDPTEMTSDEDFILTQTIENQGLAKAITDRILRTRATLGVELLFEQHKLRHQVAVLKLRSRQVRKRKALESRIRKLADEVTEISDSLGDDLADKMSQCAEEAYNQWKALRGKSAESEALRAKNELALRPQNQLDPAKAREMGKRGGAPKGNQNARKHGLVSRQMPNLACDNCPHIQVCPQYRAGHVCAYLNEFERSLEAGDDEEPEVTAVKSILVEQLKRGRRALLFETFEGGIINKETSKVLRDIQSAAQLLHTMKNPSPKFGMGLMPVPTTTTENARKGGVLESIFGDLGSKAKDATFSTDEAGEER